VTSVLVVDDRPDDRDLTALILRHHGYDVVESPGPLQALDLLRERPFDAVVSDILMPDVDGYEFVRALRADQRWRDLPVVFCSATYDERELGDLAQVYGGCRFVAKPLEPERLLTVVEAALASPGTAAVEDTHWHQLERLRLLGAKLLRANEETAEQRLELARRARRQEALAALAQHALASQVPDEVLALAARTVGDLLGTELVAVLEVRERGAPPVLVSGIGWDGDAVGRPAFGEGSGSLGALALAAPGATTVARLDETVRRPLLLERHGAVSGLTVRLGGAEDPIGILGCYTRQVRVFEPSDETFLLSAGGVVAQAMGRWRAEQERARVAAQVEQAQKLEAVGRLAGGIAHDFNNILAVIRLNCAALLRGAADDRARSQIVQVDMAAERAAELTHQLVVFGRAQVLHPEVASLNEVVEETLRLLERLIGEDVETRSELQPDLYPVLVDRPQITQMILNLAVNARDAMESGGSLRFRTRNLSAGPRPGETGTWVLLEVVDTGCGMDAATRERVFEPFFTTKDQGTGLGLATVYGIVEQSGGHIEVQSAPGEGTTFAIWLPATTGSVTPRDEPEEPGALEGDETILLVEDEPALRTIVGDELRFRGYTVIQAAGGPEALRVVESGEPIDLLVTDIVMPELNGRELAERVLERDPAVRILYTSGYPQDTVLAYGIAAGAVSFLQKPYLPGDLARKVRETLEAEPVPSPEE
jgi:signal transduction histidine kinase/DNA-binding response OmpR family regulator